MINIVTRNITRFVLLILLQALVIDHLDLAHGWVVPYLYVLFIISLPFDTPPWATLVLGFVLGMVMDFFSSTPGMHMSACVLLMFTRIHLLRLLSPREGYEFGTRPTLPTMGFAWYITYAGILIVVHHLWLFIVELHRFDGFFLTFFRALLSAVFTFALCLLAQFLTSSADRERR